MPDGLFANPLHWVILLVVALLIFGPSKLPGIGNTLGKSLKEFKHASREDAPARSTTPLPAESTLKAAADTAITICSACATPNPVAARFCSDCGATINPPPPESLSQPEPQATAAAPALAPAPGTVGCMACGVENAASNPFCLRCGRVLEGNTIRT